MVGSHPKPPDRFGVVFGYALPHRVHAAEIVLRGGVALLGCPSIPLCRRRVVLCRHGPSLIVHQSKEVLAFDVTLLGGAPVPLHGFDVVERNSMAVLEHEPEIALSLGFTLSGGFADPPGRNGPVLRHAASGGVHNAEFELGRSMALLRSQAVQDRGL